MFRPPSKLLLPVFLAIAACSGTEEPPDPTPPPTDIPTQTPTSSPTYLDSQTYFDSIVVGDQERVFLVHVPTGYEPDHPVPLVFNLHGAGSNAFAQESVSNWIQKADEEGFVVVAPQAIEPSRVWLGVFLDELGDPDIDFFTAMLAELQRELNIDPNRIYATGLSNGGTMSNRLGCDLSQYFAAIAPVAGAHSGLHLCEVSEPVSVLAIHGTDDNVIPYEGNGSDVPPVRTWVEAWAARNNCAPETTESQPYSEVIKETWSGCDGSATVSMITVQGGGHSWLGLEFVWEEGRYMTVTTATDEIWDFFTAHPKPSDG